MNPSGGKTIWSDEMLMILTAKFPICYNRELATELGVGWRTLVRKARELGIEKEEGFLEKRRPQISKMAQEARPENPTKGMKGWSVPGGEKFRFKKGNISNMTDPEVKARSVAARNATIANERLRIRYGLKQTTKLKLNSHSPAEVRFLQSQINTIQR